MHKIRKIQFGEKTANKLNDWLTDNGQSIGPPLRGSKKVLLTYIHEMREILYLTVGRLHEGDMPYRYTAW